MKEWNIGIPGLAKMKHFFYLSNPSFHYSMIPTFLFMLTIVNFLSKVQLPQRAHKSYYTLSEISGLFQKSLSIHYHGRPFGPDEQHHHIIVST